MTRIYNVTYTVGEKTFTYENLYNIWDGFAQVKAYASEHPNEIIIRKVQMIENWRPEAYCSGAFC